MKYIEFIEACNQMFGTGRPSDIARELEVSPQAINNWKIRDQVPKKYVNKLKSFLTKSSSSHVSNDNSSKDNSGFSHNSLLDDDYDIIELFLKISKIIVLNKFLISLIPMIFAIIVTSYYKFFDEPQFRSTSKFLPVSAAQSASSSVANMASKYGVNLGSGGNNANLASGQMVPDIINSVYFRTELLKNLFKTSLSSKETNLISIILKREIDLEKTKDLLSRERMLKTAVTKLNKIISISVPKRSPLLVVNVTSNDPVLSAEICNGILSTLQKIMDKFKYDRIVEKKLFINDRIIQVKSDLVYLEESLKEFREKNRRILDSPELLLTQERFIRDLQVQNQIYITLKTEFEIARIEEIVGGSHIQILDPPNYPTRKINKSLKNIFIFCLVLSFAIILIALVAFDWFRSTFNASRVKNLLN